MSKRDAAPFETPKPCGMETRQGEVLTEKMCYSYGICSFAFGKGKGCGRRNVHTHRAHRPPEERGQNAHAPEPGTGAVPRRSEESYAGDSTPDRDGRHQTQGGHQPGKGNPGTAHRKQQGHEANGSDGRLDGWCNDNLKWLRETYGERNLVSAVLHMDEKTPHIHATIVPIVTGERRKAKQDEQNGKKKYRKKSPQDVRLCADDVMARHQLKHYQDTYAQAMNKYGLQRGVDGSLAKHIPTSQYYKELVERQDSLQENIETLLGLEEEAQKKLKKVKGEINTQKMKNAAVNATTAIADGVSSLLGGSKVKRLEAENENLKRDTANLQRQVQAEQREQKNMEHRHNSEIIRIDQSYQQKIKEYDNRLKQIDTYFPIVTELLPIAEQCREVGFTEELTRQIVSLQPVGFKGRLYSKEHKEKFRTEHSTASVERNPQEKGKFQLCIDGMPILEWFRMKFQELKEKLNVSNTSKEENKPKRGLRL